jgi:glycosyltransferase involved in cell wall biosynthesis
VSAAHVAFLLGKLRAGGAERVILDLATELSAQGDRVDLVLAEASGPLLAEVPRDVRIVELGIPGALRSLPSALRRMPAGMVLAQGTPRLLRATDRLARYLRAEQPDALLATLRGPCLMAIWARREARSRSRVVVRLANHATAEARGETSPFKRDYPALVRRFYPQADRVVAVSQAMADDLVLRVGLERGAIEVIHNPVPVERIASLAMRPPERGWPDDRSLPVFVAAGRLVPQKDHATLLRAFAILRRTRDARLLILGEGEARDELLALAASLGVADRVGLPGRVENPHAYFARAAAFVLSSVFEGFPNVLLEALAAGCPVVSTDCPSGPAEILPRPELGALVPVGDAEALAGAMRRVLEKAPDRDVLRAHAASFSGKEAAARYRAVMLGR